MCNQWVDIPVFGKGECRNIHADYGYGISKKVFLIFYKKRISLFLVITKLNLAFRARNHLYLFNRSEGELKEAPSLSSI